MNKNDNSAARPGVMLYFDIRPAIQRLNAEERGVLLTAILDYAELGVSPSLDGIAGVCFDLLKPRIDRDGERYNLAILQRQFAVYCREEKKDGRTPLPFNRWLSTDNGTSSTDNGTYPTIPTPTTAPTTASASASTATTTNKKNIGGAATPPRASRFSPPSVENVRAYCLESGYCVDAEQFVDFYAANGWVQNRGKPIKDWKAAVRTWARRDRARSGGGSEDDEPVI